MNSAEFKLYLSRVDLTTRQLANLVGVEPTTLNKYSSEASFPNHILIMFKFIEEIHDLKNVKEMAMKLLNITEPVIHNSKK